MNETKRKKREKENKIIILLVGNIVDWNLWPNLTRYKVCKCTHSLHALCNLASITFVANYIFAHLSYLNIPESRIMSKCDL